MKSFGVSLFLRDKIDNSQSRDSRLSSALLVARGEVSSLFSNGNSAILVADLSSETLGTSEDRCAAGGTPLLARVFGTLGLAGDVIVARERTFVCRSQESEH